MAEPQEASARNLPSVDSLLKAPGIEKALETAPRRVVVDCVREAVAEARQELLAGASSPSDLEQLRTQIVQSALERVGLAMGPYYRRVINATGIVLHTALGRAVLPPAAIRQIVDEISGYSLLQADPETGARSRRDERIQRLVRELTGAEAATVVNNNAAATMIVLNTVAAGREVIVSRGQLVEIGGSFRLPDVMAASGARLVEVGTTNKTHLRDYERAITENTAAILRVHPSNYKVIGFTAEVPLKDLAELAHNRNLVLVDDVGAGALIDFAQFGFEPEPTLLESIQTGADLITCSTDKLIGASQGGLILGRKALIEKVRKSALARIVRVDKLTLAALEATLMLFLDQDRALREVPTLAMLRRTLAEIDAQAARIAHGLAARSLPADFEVIDGFSQMGSGSLPGQQLPTRLVAVRAGGVEAGQLARRLRLQNPPVFARVHDGRLLVDPRTVLPGEEPLVIEALAGALSTVGGR
jgi:L-seryl-tRNA(Ser) seleniumtransferase